MSSSIVQLYMILLEVLKYIEISYYIYILKLTDQRSWHVK